MYAIRLRAISARRVRRASRPHPWTISIFVCARSRRLKPGANMAHGFRRKSAISVLPSRNGSSMARPSILKPTSAQMKRRDLFRSELADLLKDDGVMVLPTVPGAAPLVSTSFEDCQAYRERCVRLFCLSGLSGFPQITLPLGEVHGAPFGISLLGPKGSDRALISLAATIFNRRKEPDGHAHPHARLYRRRGSGRVSRPRRARSGGPRLSCPNMCANWKMNSVRCCSTAPRGNFR